MNLLGNECVVQLGGGIHGHPNGTRKGAMALRQAIDATLDGISLDDYSKNHKELKEALKKWGHGKPV